MDGGDGESSRSGISIAELNQVKFLESLVTHYESLVEDMAQEVTRCHTDLKCQYENCQGQLPQNLSEVDELRLDLDRKDSLILNLQRQLDVSNKYKSVSKQLWHDSLQQAEALGSFKTLENKNAQSPLGTDTISFRSIPSDYLMKWKLLKSYAESLESRLERSTREKHFHRHKIMEIRLEYEAALKRNSIEKAKEIERTKSSYSTEIQYLRSMVEKLRKEQQNAWEKRLKAEKEVWEYETNKKLQLVKLKIERLIIDNHDLSSKEIELTYLILNLKSELQITEQQRHSNSLLFSRTKHVQCSLTSEKLKTNMNSKVTQTDFDYFTPDHYNLYKTSKTRLELEYQNILNKLEISETNCRTNSVRFQERIHQLEKLNAAYLTKITELEAQARAGIAFHQNRTDPHEDELKLEECRSTLQNISKTAGVSNTEMKCTENDLAVCKWVKDAPSWKTDTFGDEKVQLDEYVWKLRILSLNDEILRLKEDRAKLLEVVEKQKIIASKWKEEYKELITRTIH